MSLYCIKKKYFNTTTTDTAVKSKHFPIYLKIKDNYFKVQLENDLDLPVSYHEFKTKAKPIEQTQQNKTKHINENQLPLEFYPIVQHTDVTLKTNKTETFIHLPQKAN